MRDTLEAQESMLRRKEKQASSRQKWEEKGAVITVTGLHCATYIDAEKKPRIAGTKVSEIRDTELESGHPGSWKPQAWHHTQ